MMSVISAVSVGVLLCIFSMPTLSVLPMAMAVVMLGASITPSVLSCRTLCCGTDTTHHLYAYIGLSLVESKCPCIHTRYSWLSPCHWSRHHRTTLPQHCLFTETNGILISASFTNHLCKFSQFVLIDPLIPIIFFLNSYHF